MEIPSPPFLKRILNFSSASVGWEIIRSFHQVQSAFRNKGWFEEVVLAPKEAIQLRPDEVSPRMNLAVTYILMGHEKDAQARTAEVFRMNSKFTAGSWAKTFAYKDQSQQDRIVNAGRKAGLK